MKPNDLKHGIRTRLRNFTRGSFEENYGRDNIAAAVARQHRVLGSPTSLRILDIGAGYGKDLELARHATGGNCHLIAIECDPACIAELRRRRIEVHSVDIEREPLPLGAGSVDVVIANQVLEHTKDIFWIVNEIQRVLAADGVAVIGVPNIASFHNRVGMLVGMQPTQIEPLSAHVRGFTAPSLARFLEAGDCFVSEDLRGANFYPFPRPVARRLARWFPKASWGVTLTARKLDTDRQFIEVLSENSYETPYFRG